MSSGVTVEDGIVRGPRRDFQLPRESLGRALLQKFIGFGDSDAQVYPQHGRLTVTYRELSGRAARVSLELEQRGLGPGDVLVVATGVVPLFTPLMVGAAARGVVVAPINPGFDANDLRTLLTETLQPRLVLAQRSVVSKIQTACPEVDVVDMTDFEELLERHDVPLDSNGYVDLERVCVEDEPGWLEKTTVIMCSSGTTGLPKGVMLTNRNILYQLVIFSESELELDVGTISLQYTPIFWVSGIFFQLISSFTGGRLIVMPGFEEKTIVKTVQEYKVEFMFLAPNSAVALCKANATFELSSLRLLMVGGASMDSQTQRMVEEALGVEINQWYGMTEVLIVIGSSGHGEVPSGSVGRVQSNVQAKVVHPETGKILGPNQEGELCFRSPMVTKGYYRRPDATAQAIDAEGWFHSGDIGYYDDNLFFYVTDRLKDLIKYCGNHVAPSELEGILLTNPVVKEAAVVGVPHLLDQEHPRAYVVLQPGANVTKEELLEMVNGQVADFKKLRGGIAFVDVLPKTATGKISRRDLRNQAKEEAAATS